MRLFGQRKRQVPPPERLGPHQSRNPMFGLPSAAWTTFRQQVMIATIFGLIGLTAIWLIYGPWFAITNLTVTGTRLLDPQSVQRLVNRYLDDDRWLVLPNRTLWTMSATHLTRYLEKQIQRRLSVERVVVHKQAPSSLRIIINERTPVAIWTNGTTSGSVDKQGKIIELRTAVDATQPTIRDENAVSFKVDSSVVKPEVMTSWQNIATSMRQANIQVNEYLVPIPVCLPTITVPSDTNASSTTNLNLNNLNLNPANLNTNPVTANVNSSQPVPLPCDREALRYGSPEIHAQLTDGPRVLFDRHSDLAQAVQALKRVLSERTDKVPRIIDVRFAGRVYVQ
ncbi:MAG: hypothetical protein AAB619_01495 [Patescibacteria group bacterium]